jgi:hypothetical protein
MDLIDDPSIVNAATHRGGPAEIMVREEGLP